MHERPVLEICEVISTISISPVWTDLFRHSTWSALTHQSESGVSVMSQPDNVLVERWCHFNILQMSSISCSKCGPLWKAAVERCEAAPLFR